MLTLTIFRISVLSLALNDLMQIAILISVLGLFHLMDRRKTIDLRADRECRVRQRERI